MRGYLAAACLALLAGTGSADTPDMSAGMQYMPPVAAQFYTFWRQAYGRPFAEQERLWDRLVEAPRRDLYASVVWERHDEAARRRQLQRRFAAYVELAPRILLGTQNLIASVAAQNERFRRLFPGADAEPPVEVVLAPGFDAKSGVRGDGRPVLALAVDSLLLERADLDVVLPHELFHLYHAEHAGIRNDGAMPGADLTLPLFEEGLATYVSSQLAPGRSDGQWLLQDELGTIAPQRQADIARRFLADASARAVDPAHPEAFRRWFNAGARPYQDGLPNRTGYWLGLQLVRRLRQEHDLAEIAAWPPAQAMRRTREALRAMAAASPGGG
ncbi:hypothetical protein ASG87_11415 [Frateuria sp. Soil773]|nr:hypothetical protein ASG87_11415 [Frateuria sp. Soil773]